MPIEVTMPGVGAVHLGSTGDETTPDEDAYRGAAHPEHVIVTKDSDFVELPRRLGAPPSLLRVRVGNTRRIPLIEMFQAHFAGILLRLRSGETLVTMPPDTD